jgi:thiamine pyrophosphate-dependent acetolactate synthase large subunit-like protein
MEISRSGGQALVEALKIHGSDLAFCVPGESPIWPCSTRFMTRATRSG